MDGGKCAQFNFLYCVHAPVLQSGKAVRDNRQFSFWGLATPGDELIGILILSYGQSGESALAGHPLEAFHSDLMLASTTPPRLQQDEAMERMAELRHRVLTTTMFTRVMNLAVLLER